MYYCDKSDGEALVTHMLRDTLAAMSMPLAAKVLYFQSLLTQRLTFGSVRDAASTRNQVWGTRVLWQHRPRTPYRSCSVGDRTDLDGQSCDVPDSSGSNCNWILVRLKETGLKIHRGFQSTPIMFVDEVHAPYWAIVLSAIYCGAHDLWFRHLKHVLATLKVSAASRDFEPVRSELCQRCGHTYETNPCHTKTVRTSAVDQIDRILCGRACTALCCLVDATACENGRYCLSHKWLCESNAPRLAVNAIEKTDSRICERAIASWWCSDGQKEGPYTADIGQGHVRNVGHGDESRCDSRRRLSLTFAMGQIHMRGSWVS